MNPKVFISHASEDKKRFVIDLSTKLRENGIDAWLDKWEMLSGDSLVDKIFEEGIKEADSFIIILSKYSIDKPWVKEELNASFIKRINKNSKIIPIVIDDCQVPECLQSTIWENINDFNDYEENFTRIINSIFGVTDKPSLGKTPSYVDTKINLIQDLNKIDTIIFTETCQQVMASSDTNISTSQILDNLNKYGLSDEDISDTLEILDSKGYIDAITNISGMIFFFTVTTYGFEQFAKSNISNYDQMIDNVCLTILNHKLENNIDIQEKTNYSLALINHIFDLLENKGLIKYQKMMSGFSLIINISPELKRIFR